MPTVYEALIAEHPDVALAIFRKRWNYADALAAADKAIAARKKAPAKKAAKRAPKKAAS